MNLKTHALALSLAGLCAFSTLAQEKTTVNIFDGALFYDGYLLKNNPDKDLDDGILRHSTSLYAVKLSDEQLACIGSDLSMEVHVQACCDNYDRIGNINLALVPKGSATYETDQVSRIELGRFITPFMDKNKQPDIVPYSFEVNYLSNILRDSSLREIYDLWIEFELFGIPYAANTQVAGCKDRNDVFRGFLDFVTSNPAAPLTTDNVLVPIVMKKPEYIGNNLNNYNENATDEIGTTIKTYTYEVPADVKAAQLVIVTSNHGANAGGEEYKRRKHYVYTDGELALTYIPGRGTCEPFRQYNTQPNGIYGASPQSGMYWIFSNWCPGDVIDNRIVELGEVTAGTHTVTISVPKAEFKDQQGDIPVSIFFQGSKDGSGLSSIADVYPDPLADIVISGRNIFVHCAESEIMSLSLYDLKGNFLDRVGGSGMISASGFDAGVYLLCVEMANGLTEAHKIALK
ncbi:MAG: hypothetical protein K2F63_03925 [Muribaculaceae bacterium]|nr:hypothetical protein [Muribaculaceae bacterium]